MVTIAMPERLTRERYELPALITIAVAGAAVGFGISSLGGLTTKAHLLERTRGTNGRHLLKYSGDAFRHSGEFRMWLFLIVVQTALWAVAAFALLSPEM